jgi:DNA-binding PadR family transcriptional regulator
MDALTAFQRDVLYVIAGKQNAHGLAIKKELDQYYEGEIHHGRLYPNLDTLVENGFVEKGEIDRRTNSYNLSPKGEKTLRDRREWESKYTKISVST